MFNRICMAICGISTVGVLCLASSVHAQNVISGPLVSPVNNHTYYLLESATWTASEAKAVALGGHLATIRNLAENVWIYDQFSMFSYAGKTDRGLWIGLNDAAVEGTFIWSSGEPVTFTNWGAGEPVNQNGTDDYVHIFWPHDGREPGWNDMWDADNYANIPISGVVEIAAAVPEPGDIALLFGFAVSGAAYLLRRRR